MDTNLFSEWMEGKCMSASVLFMHNAQLLELVQESVCRYPFIVPINIQHSIKQNVNYISSCIPKRFEASIISLLSEQIFNIFPPALAGKMISLCSRAADGFK